MESINATNPEQQQSAATPTPEASGEPEKLFTQADLDRIIGERLARERAKAEPSPEDVREADLRAREARISCREFITENGYPAALLDILDTSDPERFQTAVEKLDGIAALPSRNRKPVPRFTAPMGGGTPRPTTDALFREAFKPPEF